MQIRTYIESDREALIALWQACGLTRPWNDPNKDIDRKILFQPNLFLVGHLGAQIMGSAMAGYDGHRGSVFYLAIKPSYQGRGYGQIMMGYIEDLLTQLGCPKLNIAVRNTNTSALDFYGQLNYAVDDAVSFGKRLIPDV